MKKKIDKSLLSICIIIFFCSIFACYTTFGQDSYAHASEEEVFLGGTPIGIIANSEGLLVSEIVNVTSSEGCFSPALKAGIKKGDIILAVNGEKLNDITRLSYSIQKSEDCVILTIQRGNDKVAISVSPIFDITQNAKKIGIAVKNNIAGIGTMTFIKNGGDYGALGHQIIDSFGNGSTYVTGKVFLCDITGYNTPNKDTPGELLGKINTDTSPIGSLKKNKFCGIFGIINEKNYYCDREKIKVGHKSEVRPGKAYIVTTINGESPQKYQIEIVKTVNQNNPDEKSMVLRVTDKRLLASTHGILQGMSGSPIVQDDKLIGAVTHVFTNDSTMGYGIYIDWMINEA